MSKYEWKQRREVHNMYDRLFQENWNTLIPEILLWRKCYLVLLGKLDKADLPDLRRRGQKSTGQVASKGQETRHTNKRQTQ